MAAPTPPAGYTSGELDNMFARLMSRADIAREQELMRFCPPSFLPYLHYYFGVPPSSSAYWNGSYAAPLYANSIATAVIKASAGKALRILVVTPGSAGSLTLNDVATVGGATGGNQIFTALFSAMKAGDIIDLNITCATGLVVSAMPTGGQFTIVYV